MEILVLDLAITVTTSGVDVHTQKCVIATAPRFPRTFRLNASTKELK
jgi:hypothetical protein